MMIPVNTLVSASQNAQPQDEPISAVPGCEWLVDLLGFAAPSVVISSSASSDPSIVFPTAAWRR